MNEYGNNRTLPETGDPNLTGHHEGGATITIEDEVAIRKLIAQLDLLKARPAFTVDEQVMLILATMIFIVTAARGSVGKSTWSHALIEFLRMLGFTVLIIDADMRRPNLSSTYVGRYRTVTQRLDLKVEGAIETLAEIIEENPGCPIVINLGAEADVNLSGAAIVETINELVSLTNRQLYVHWLLRREADGPEDLAKFLGQGLNCRAAAVLNLEAAARERFEHFDARCGDGSLKLDAVFELPEMAARVSNAFFEDGLPASTLLATGSLSEKLDASKWLRTCFSNIVKGMADATRNPV